MSWMLATANAVCTVDPSASLSVMTAALISSWGPLRLMSKSTVAWLTLVPVTDAEAPLGSTDAGAALAPTKANDAIPSRATLSVGGGGPPPGPLPGVGGGAGRQSRPFRV